MKNRLNKLMILALSMVMLMSACKNEDPLDLSLKIKATDIKGTSATISWELFSQQVLAHDVTITESETGALAFEGMAGIDLTTSAAKLEIEATGLKPETNYTVVVVANTVDESWNAVKVKEDKAEFKTIELQADEMENEEEGEAEGETFTTEELATKWIASTQYYVLNADKTGEYGSRSEIIGIDDEKEYDITWETTTIAIDEMNMTTGEVTEKTVNGIKVIDPEGFYVELEFKVVDSVQVLYDNDNSTSFRKGEQGGEEEGEETVGDTVAIENIQYEDNGDLGFSVSWNLVDIAKGGYKVMIELEDGSVLATNATESPVTLNKTPTNGGIIRINGYADDNYQELVAKGEVIYSNGDGVNSNEDATFDEYIDFTNIRIEAENFIRGGEGIGYHDLDDSNEGKSDYREGGIDITSRGESSNGNHVSYIRDEEWLVYNIAVPSTGYYHIKVQYSAGEIDNTNEYQAGKINFSEIIDGSDSDLSGDIHLANTRTYSNYRVAFSQKFQLTEGNTQIKLKVSTGYVNIDYFEIIAGIPEEPSSNLVDTKWTADFGGGEKSELSFTDSENLSWNDDGDIDSWKYIYYVSTNTGILDPGTSYSTTFSVNDDETEITIDDPLYYDTKFVNNDSDSDGDTDLGYSMDDFKGSSFTGTDDETIYLTEAADGATYSKTEYPAYDWSVEASGLGYPAVMLRFDGVLKHFFKIISKDELQTPSGSQTYKRN